MMEYMVTFSESFLQLASAPDSPLTTLDKYKFVNVTTVFITKDTMQIKLGLSFDNNGNNLLEVKLNIDSKCISDNPSPDKHVLKNNMLHECEVLCITIADNKLSIPYAVNHLPKSISEEETAKKMSNQAIQTHVCVHHLKNRLININNSVIKNTIKCFSSRQGRAEIDSMCYSCVE